MPLPNLPVPPFPNVPKLPGVPPLLRAAAGAAQNRLSVLTGGLIPKVGQGPPVWGIFDLNGQPVITGDSCLSMEGSQEFRIADFPVEQGSFASYNKVEIPFDAKLQFVKTGSPGEVSDFMGVVADVVASLDLYQVVTPEKTYLDMNPVHYDYRRTASEGATMLTIDVWLRRVRIAPSAQFTNTKEASGEATKSDGTVQATPIPSATAIARRQIVGAP